MQFPIKNSGSSRRTILHEVPGDFFFDADPFEAIPLARLQTLVSPAIEAVTVDRIKQSATPAMVYRLTMAYGPDAAGLPSSLIAKRVAPNWADDTTGHRREYEFYRQWASRLGDALPHVTYAGPEPDTDYGLILLEDVAAGHRFSPADHLWRPDELSQALRAYARLHVRGAALIDDDQRPDWLFPRYEDRVIARAAELPEMVASLAEQGKLRPLQSFDTLVEWVVNAIDTYKALPATLLHNDVAPQNIGLPRRGSDASRVVLVDWEMVGSGPAEMDLAYVFMQPFGNTRQVDREVMLDVYWQERQRLEGVVPPVEERRERQRWADALFALWLIPVAWERSQQSFPPGSAPRVYWDSMHAVLDERLQALTAHER